MLFAQSNAQPATISSAEARAIVETVLKNRNIHLSDRYCELKSMDGNGKPFVTKYYTFGGSCDYPRTAATTPFGVYVVSPRTGEVWEFNTCEHVTFPALTRIQTEIKHRTGNTDVAEAQYREHIGCDTTGTASKK